MGVKDRLIKFVETKSLSVAEFERRCSLSNALIGNIKGSISQNTLNKISSVYPDLNKDWLLHGEGDMLKQPSEYKYNEQNPTIEDKKNQLFLNQECSTCKEREKRIEEYKSEVDQLRGQISFLQHIIETQCLDRPPSKTGTGPP
jgi:hypothetical protein